MRKKFMVVVISMMMLLSFGITAYAASASETAYVYGFDYGADDVNTTAIADQERMYLANLGYQAYCNTKVSASFAIGTSPTTGTSRMNSGVVAFNGHAGPGSCQFRDDKGNNTYLTAIKSGSGYSKFGDTDMSNCKAALFFGCNTASTERDSTYGTLTTKAVEKGADCSFGWKESVYTDSATTFRERMFYFLRYGYAVKDAAANAASEMPWLDATKKYVVSGTGTTKLTLTKAAVNDEGLISYDEAMKIMHNDDYRFMEELDDGTKVYVKYINNIPTLESIDVFPDMLNAKKTSIEYDEVDVKQAKMIQPISTYSIKEIPQTVKEGGIQFLKSGESESVDVYCKLSGEVKLVRIIETEYISSDGECYLLDNMCFDLTTGEEIDYADILDSVL